MKASNEPQGYTPLTIVRMNALVSEFPALFYLVSRRVASLILLLGALLLHLRCIVIKQITILSG